jgi:DNA-binding NarL/FixJ family response regulator
MDEAVCHFEAALVMHERLGSPPLLAISQYELARTLFQRDERADVARARDLLDTAEATAHALGNRRLGDLAEALRRASMADASPAALTPREIEVLRLIAAGRSNHEIADELTISLNTVLHHVTSILGKTAAANRAEAAVYAAQHGLLR